MKMKLSKFQKSPPWTMEDLEAALSHLKNNKSRDYEGYVNEMFKNDVIGSDLKKSLLVMFNRKKERKSLPPVHELC